MFYGFIVSNEFYKKFNTHNQFGLSISPEKTPIGAIEYLRKEGYKDQKIFSDMLVSNYALWALRPGFKSFLDQRDLDIFPKEMFENTYTLLQNPEIKLRSGQSLWQLMDSSDHYQYILLLNRPEYKYLHHYISDQTCFQHVYSDPLATVYKRGTGIKDTNQSLNVSGFTFFPTNKLSRIINKIYNPFYTDISEREYDINAIQSAVQDYFRLEK
jgi:hypothetical protein